MTMHQSITILKDAARQQRRKYLDVIYGPRAVELRAKIASALFGKPLPKSAKECQYGRLRLALLALVKVSGGCAASEDSNFQEALDAIDDSTADATNETFIAR